MPETTYGATIDEVKSHLPHLELEREASEIGGEGRLSETDVNRFIESMGRWVRARIGSLEGLDADKIEAAEGLARTAVVLGAATWAEAGAFPERADIATTTYAGFLYKAYTDALNELLESLGIGTESGGGDTAPGVPDKPAAAFPPPLFRRDTAY